MVSSYGPLLVESEVGESERKRDRDGESSVALSYALFVLFEWLHRRPNLHFTFSSMVQHFPALSRIPVLVLLFFLNHQKAFAPGRGGATSAPGSEGVTRGIFLVTTFVWDVEGAVLNAARTYGLTEVFSSHEVHRTNDTTCKSSVSRTTACF